MDRPELLVDIVEVAMMSGPSCPSASSQQYLWSWCAKHIFCLPVSNAIAERQFNIGSIYLSHNESEESKQASHLFVENVLHSDRDGEDRVTSHHKEQTAQMKNITLPANKISRCLHTTIDHCHALQREIE
eukprot:scpid88873/ scgid1655/ 